MYRSAPAASVLGVLALFVAAPAAQGTDCRRPDRYQTGFVSNSYRYSAIGRATGDQKHNRTEGVVRTTMLGARVRGTRFIHDYAAPTLQYSTPQVIVLVPEDIHAMSRSVIG